MTGTNIGSTASARQASRAATSFQCEYAVGVLRSRSQNSPELSRSSSSVPTAAGTTTHGGIGDTVHPSG
jgi:hypothetical protein